VEAFFESPPLLEGTEGAFCTLEWAGGSGVLTKLESVKAKFESVLAAARRFDPRAFASSAIVLFITTVLLVLVEGASSIFIALRGPVGPGDRVPLERAHTEFDRDLGWINSRNARLNDLYGNGRYLETNSQRFRNNRTFSDNVPRDKVRAVCTGDSFTLGYGVSNDDTWCELLGRRDSRFETVNMGQGGYGVDQAYLWYRRDGVALESDVLVFAFTATDFGRMMCTTFLGYPKPLLSLERGKPVIKQRPTYLGYLLRGLGQRLKPLRNLRFVELWRSRGPADKNIQLDFRVMEGNQARALAIAMFEDLAAIQAQRKAKWIVVLLPALSDYQNGEADEWRGFLSDELGKRHIAFLDLVAALRSMPETTVSMLYRGHYNEIGNRWVADKVYEALVNLPRVRERLQQIHLPSTPIEPLFAAEFQLEVEPIPLSEVHLKANSMGGLAALALDGSLATRWQSGALQNGHEELLIDLGKPTLFRQVRLELGAWDYDYARGLAVGIGNEEGRITDVLNVPGEQVTVKHLNGTGEAQLLTLRESVEARYVRIRQVGHSTENFWSIAEIGLLREK
jgi:hypothetical protein